MSVGGPRDIELPIGIGARFRSPLAGTMLVPLPATMGRIILPRGQPLLVRRLGAEHEAFGTGAPMALTACSRAELLFARNC